MPIYDYALLALLASGSHGLEGFTLTLGPDAIVQPKGGGLVLVSDQKHKPEIEVNTLSSNKQSKSPLQNNQQKLNTGIKGSALPQTSDGVKGSPQTAPGYDLRANKAR